MPDPSHQKQDDTDRDKEQGHHFVLTLQIGHRTVADIPGDSDHVLIARVRRLYLAIEEVSKDQGDNRSNRCNPPDVRNINHLARRFRGRRALHELSGTTCLRQTDLWQNPADQDECHESQPDSRDVPTFSHV